MAFLPAPASAQDISGRASVVDGDTLEVRGVRIRLFGIDAPEGQQLCKKPSGETWRCGQQSALALSEKLGQATVVCSERATDRYGRSVAVCFLGGEDINGWLVQEGWAVAMMYPEGEKGGRGKKIFQQNIADFHRSGVDGTSSGHSRIRSWSGNCLR